MKITLILTFTFFIYFNTFSQTKILMNNKNGVYTIPVIVNGVSMEFVLDTGASTIVISSIEAAFLLKQGSITEDDINDTKYGKVADGSIIEGTSINIKKIQIGSKVIENIEAIVLNNLQAPLLFGQSALKKLGKYSIEDNYFIFNDGSLNSEIDYSTIELNSDNLKKIFTDNEIKNYEKYNNLYLIKIDSLKQLSNNNGLASFKLSEIYKNLNHLFWGGAINPKMLNYKELNLLKDRFEKEKIILLEKAIDQKYYNAYIELAHMYYNSRKNNEKALKYYKLAYEKGVCTSCAVQISELYNMLEKKAEAFNWAFKASTKHGDSWWFTSRGTSMGDFYQFGIGTPINVSEALKWYLKDEEFLKIADLYFSKEDKTKNFSESIKYYKKAIEKVISEAKKSCDCDNYDGYVSELYYNETGGWASYYLYLIYNDSKYKKYNEKIAIEYLNEAAHIYYNEIALYTLGYSLENGVFHLKDEKKAFDLYYESSIRDFVKGQYNLGRCYLFGIGTIKNLKKAAHWIKLSHNNGNKDAEILWNKFELWKYYEEVDEDDKYID